MTQQPTSPTSLPRLVVHGSFWNYVSFISGKLLNFVTTLILARLLIPEQFGLVGYCTTAIQYFDIMNSAGINNSLLARKDKIEEAANSALVINIIMGVFSIGLSWFIAPLLADFFKAEEVTGLFRLLSVVLLINGLGLVPGTLLQRNLQFRTMSVPYIVGNLAKGVTSIVLALLNYGPWSLVWGQIVGELVSTIYVWILAKWWPTFKFDWKVTKELGGYGSHIIVIGFAGALLSNVDYIIIGRVLGAAALGIYTMAYRIPELTIGSLNSVTSRALLPLISQMQTDEEAIRSFCLNFISYITVFTFSIGVGLAMVSKLIVENLLSSDWLPAILPMALMSIALAISTVGHTFGAVYKSINRPEVLTRVAFVKLPIIILLIIFFTRWGIIGVAVGQLVFALVSFLIDCVVANRVVRIKYLKLIDALAPAAISSLIMALVIGAVQLTITISGWGGFAIIILLGVVIYVMTLSLLRRDMLVQIFKIIKKEVLSL
jgi:O-antigen/teichoic acid export membrane protein